MTENSNQSGADKNSADTTGYVFVSLDIFKIRGKKCFVVKNPHECSSFKHLKGTVIIDGKKQNVIGIERFMHAPPWRAGEHISLMVET